MKLSFSTLGCPDWSFEEVFTTAKDLGLDGVEVRGLSDKIHVPDIEAFKPNNIEKTKAFLNTLGLEIPMLTSGATLADPKKSKDSFVEACQYINLASGLGAKYIRVMGTGEPKVTDGDFEQGAKLLQVLCEYASLYNVTVLIETNGKLSNSQEMLKLIEMSGAQNCGVLWDVHHTVVFGNESPKDTVKALGSLIKHVHIKDSVVTDGKIQYKMLGHGEIPVVEAIDALKDINYDGFVSLEWVKRWNPDLQEPGIVFAHFATYMKNLLK